jgi:hypothetical protein
MVRWKMSVNMKAFWFYEDFSEYMDEKLAIENSDTLRDATFIV